MSDNISWVDLPHDDYTQILGYSNEQIEQLNHLVTAYYDLEKSDEDSLPIRVERLEDIIEFLDDWIQKKLTSIDKPKHLKILKDISEKKRNYLLALVTISQFGNETHQYQNYYHKPEIEKNDLEIVYLNPRRMYSIKKREHWGDFWWVSLDPCHRQLTNYLMLWESSLKKENSKAIDFFLWLETQNVPIYYPCEKYLDENELAETEIIIKNGLLYNHAADNALELANFNKQGKKYLYVVGLDKKLRVLVESSEIYHSSFYKGKPVFSAGKINIVNGIITSVSFESGHYIPSIKVGHQLFKILQSQGVVFAESTEVSYFYDRNKYTTVVPKSILINLDVFTSFIEEKANTTGCEKAE